MARYLSCMATSPLTPEQRVNKLGHLVTKHVKTPRAATMTPSTLPAPHPSTKAKTTSSPTRLTLLAGPLSSKPSRKVAQKY